MDPLGPLAQYRNPVLIQGSPSSDTLQQQAAATKLRNPLILYNIRKSADKICRRSTEHKGIVRLKRISGIISPDLP
jgi:hypothetical protein